MFHTQRGCNIIGIFYMPLMQVKLCLKAHLRECKQQIGTLNSQASWFCVRQYLAHYLQCNSKDLIFERHADGKPYVVGPPLAKRMSFNISHTSNYLAIAISADSYHVGIDIEQLRPNLNVLELAKRFFFDVEYKALVALPLKEQLIEFHKFWVLKEAILKAAGFGLQKGLRQICLSPSQVSQGYGAVILHNSETKRSTKFFWQLYNQNGSTLLYTAIAAERPFISIPHYLPV